MYDEKEIKISEILKLSYLELINILDTRYYLKSIYKNRKLIEHINALCMQFENKNINIEKVFTNKEKINLKILLYTNETDNLQLIKQILISKIKTNV